MEQQAENPKVTIETSMGTIQVELWKDKAPLSVDNFLKYTDDKFFDGLIFHRVIKDFMIQGGGFTSTMARKATRGPIKNEARKDVPNARGTLAMARTSDLDSATSQFFMNLVDNDFLDHHDETSAGFGYAVFGAVTAGIETVDKIAAVKTGKVGPHADVPVTPVEIRSVRRA